jgi:hypothetical protein
MITKSVDAKISMDKERNRMWMYIDESCQKTRKEKGNENDENI